MKVTIQLMNLENGYYLAKLEDEDDYVSALAKGPWVIYGQDLAIQPKSSSFLMSQGNPYKIMVLI